MSFEPPADSLIQQAFPQVQDLILLDKGGFKAVYRATIGGKIEAFKLILIPAYADNPDAALLRQESIGRVRREVESLARCQGVEIVKLGSLQLTHVQISNSDYVGYSEEFLEGGGGRLPIQRYLSRALLNRITFYEFNQLRGLTPSIVNQLPSDSLYEIAVGSEPQRNIEVIQSWETIKNLNNVLIKSDQLKSLKTCHAAIKEAGR